MLTHRSRKEATAYQLRTISFRATNIRRSKVSSSSSTHWGNPLGTPSPPISSMRRLSENSTRPALSATSISSDSFLSTVRRKLVPSEVYVSYPHFPSERGDCRSSSDLRLPSGGLAVVASNG